MYAKLLGLLLFVCQIILNESYVIEESKNSVSVGTVKRSSGRTSSLPEGYVTFPEIHAALKLYKNGKTWHEASDQCTAEGAHLAITDSVRKIQLINSLNTNGDLNQWIHVGIHYSSTTYEWVRVDTEQPPSFIPWRTSNPDGTGECVGISLLGPELVDYGCSATHEWFACEIFLNQD